MKFIKKILSYYQLIKYPLLVFLISRLFIIIILQLGFILTVIPYGQNYYDVFPNKIFINGLTQWDAGWYVVTAQEGYSLTKYPHHNNLVFMPLYPLAIRRLSYTGVNLFIAGIITSNTAFLFTLILLHRFIINLFNKNIADKALLLITFSPFAIFFSAVYTESLFLLFTVSSFYLFIKKRWLLCGLLASLAGLTRIVGIFIPVACLLSLFIENRFQQNNRTKPLLLFSGFIGPLLYLLFITIKFGAPWLILQSQENFGGLFYKRLTFIYQTINSSLITHSFSQIPNLLVVFLSVFLGFLAYFLILKTWKKIPLFLSIWTVFALALSFADPPCLGRHVITFFPIFVSAVILIKNRNLFNCIFGISVFLFIIISLLYSHGFFVA